jgi:hypothetical protein
MGDAQIGLLIVTPLIIAVGIALRRMGALGSSGLLAVIAMSIAAAAVLFFSH